MSKVENHKRNYVKVLPSFLRLKSNPKIRIFLPHLKCNPLSVVDIRVTDKCLLIFLDIMILRKANNDNPLHFASTLKTLYTFFRNPGNCKRVTRKLPVFAFRKFSIYEKRGRTFENAISALHFCAHRSLSTIRCCESSKNTAPSLF